MSNSPKLCIPAYELLQALYRPEEAEKVYEAMTPTERKKTDYIMTRLNAKKEEYSSFDSVITASLHNSLVEEGFDATENICQYLKCLGYMPQSIPASLTLGVSQSVFIAEW